MTLLLAIVGAIFALFIALKGTQAAKESIIFDALPSSVAQWKKEILTASQMTGVPAEIIAAVIWQESWPPGNPDSIGDNGTSFGLMQVKQGAALDVERIYNYDTSDWKDDPLVNVITGSYYLKNQRNNHSNWNEALEAYNQGATGRTKPDKSQLAINYRNKVNNKINQIT